MTSCVCLTRKKEKDYFLFAERTVRITCYIEPSILGEVSVNSQKISSSNLSNASKEETFFCLGYIRIDSNNRNIDLKTGLLQTTKRYLKSNFNSHLLKVD